MSVLKIRENASDSWHPIPADMVTVGGTIKVLEGDITGTDESYLDITHNLGVVPICAIVTRSESQNSKVTKAIAHKDWICTNSPNNPITSLEYQSNGNRTYYTQYSNSSGYNSWFTTSKARLGGGMSTRSYVGTYHYKIYYEV